MSDLERLVKTTFDKHPETIGSNLLLWDRISRRLERLYGIETLEDFHMAYLKGQIYHQHSIAAAASTVRKMYPEYEPTEEQKAVKLEVQQRYIDNYRNA